MSEVQIAIIDQENTQIALAVPGVQGPAGAISSGGSANQVFYKVSGTNYDAGWTFIGNANVDAAAAIVDTKLDTIATAGKVSNSATTATSANTASAIVARDASGNFTAGTITANLTGTASAIADNSVTSAKIVDGTIVNADIAAAAEIAVSKLANGTARQILQTAANGTDVEFTSNVDIPGTLDVTSTATFDAIVTIGGLNAVSTTKAQDEESQIKLNAAFSVGTAGAVPFGIGPVIPPGMAFAGIGPDAYNPIHLLSGSFC